MNKRTRIVVCVVLLAIALCLTALAPRLSADAANSAPVAENLEFSTYRNISVGGRLSAVDPDGDVVTFQITTEPSKGAVELTDDGRFVYTPDMNRRGRDYFGYKATDAGGNVSQEATVIIRIEKQKTAVTYEDMTGNGSQYAAVALAENGIFTGEQIGSSWVFQPDREVTRGEFLSMCMQLSGEKLLTGVVTTGFTDDAEIPLWQKSCVATALMDGVVSGYTGEYGAVFVPDAPITRSEAAVILNNVLDLADVSAERWEVSAPTWACQAAANLSACGIMPDGGDYDAGLTRENAALMLVSALNVLSGR